jgi:hypothetical protein
VIPVVLSTKVAEDRPVDVAGQDAVPELIEELEDCVAKIAVGINQLDALIVFIIEALLRKSSNKFSSHTHTDIATHVEVGVGSVPTEERNQMKGTHHGDLGSLPDFLLFYVGDELFERELTHQFFAKRVKKVGSDGLGGVAANLCLGELEDPLESPFAAKNANGVMGMSTTVRLRHVAWIGTRYCVYIMGLSQQEEKPSETF